MIRREEGFTLVELIITVMITLFALAATSTIFIGLLTQFKQQSKIAETSIEGLVGLELMRQSIESAGVGLPWDINGAAYAEAVSAPNSQLNDAPPNAPAAVRCKSGVTMNNQSDLLAIKSVTVGGSNTSYRWTELSKNDLKKPGLSGDTFSNGDHVIVLVSGRMNNSAMRQLVLNAGQWSTTYSSTSNYAPTDDETNIIYGVGDPATNLRMPFNRADFYIKQPAKLPARCHPNTGVLYKGVIKHADGTLNELPLLDCAVTMKAIFALDKNNDGNLTYVGDISAMTTSDIRTQLKEVRVYILAQEGQQDPGFTFPSNTVTVGEFGVFPAFDMTALPGYTNYRWKQYMIIAKVAKLSGSR